MTYTRLTRNAPWVRIVYILLAIVAVILLSRIITRTAGGEDGPQTVTGVWEPPHPMSNIVESASVVTNVVDADNASGCNICKWDGISPRMSFPAVLGGGDCKAYHSPTERTQTTTVTRIDTLKFNWLNRPWTARIETVLSETVRKWKLNEEWKEVQE